MKFHYQKYYWFLPSFCSQFNFVGLAGLESEDGVGGQLWADVLHHANVLTSVLGCPVQQVHQGRVVALVGDGRTQPEVLWKILKPLSKFSFSQLVHLSVQNRNSDQQKVKIKKNVI